jgi:hypothetical protein
MAKGQRQVLLAFSKVVYLLLVLEQADTFTSLTSPSQEGQPSSGYDIGSVKERTNGCEASPLLYNSWVNQP